MRVLETLIAITTLATIAAVWMPGRRERRSAVAILNGANVLLAVAHLAVEGQRWQMWPGYAVVAGLALVALRRRPARPKTSGAIAALIGIAACTALALLLPVPRFPRPTGPYATGTVTYHWIDPTRAAAYGDNPTAPREIMAQIWYPAEKARNQRPVKWLDGGVDVSRAMAKWSGFPIFLIDQTALARTHAYEDANMSGDQPTYPVIVYIHGWGGFRNINQDQIEALVSHGYVVVSADHAYGALISVYPDGRVAYNDPRALRGQDGDEDDARAANALMKVFAADARFILDQMVNLNANDPDGRFTGRLDVANVGFFGHSTGGGGLAYACAVDERCAAAFGQDAWVEPVLEEVLAEGFTQPLLLIDSASWRAGKNVPSQRQLYEAGQKAGYFLSIDGTQHYDFVAIPTFSPLAPVLGVKGPLPAQRVMEINSAYLVAFFDKHLRGETVSLLDGPSTDYPEVHFEER